MKYWLHRISHHAEVSYSLLEMNKLSIGFSNFLEEDYLDVMISEKLDHEKRQHSDDLFNEVWGSLPRTRNNLWRFINEFKKGDIVIVPSWGVFSAYELISDNPLSIQSLDSEELKDWHGNNIVLQEGKLYNGENYIDLGYYWQVKPIFVNASRRDFAKAALSSRMKIRMTNCDISDLAETIQESIELIKSNTPVNIYRSLLDTSIPKITSLINSELDPDKFEYLVKFYFERCGASEVYIPAKNESGKEGDADVIAVFEPLRAIIYTQVKFHKEESETNEWAVNQISAYRENKERIDDGYTSIAWVVSSANSFSEDCINKAKENNVHLIDGQKFSEMIFEIGIHNLNKVF